jgi:ribosome-associated protein
MASRKITRHRASPITPAPANFRMEMTEDRQAAKAANRSSVPSRDLAIAIARLAADDKCTDVLVLDTRGLNPVSDYVIIASGTSDRQMRATCQHLEELGEELGHPPYRSSKDQRAVWLLVDFVDVIFHVFEPNTRAHYDLEMMWGDAPRVLWERPEGSRPPALETSGTMADRTAAAAQERDANERAEVDQAGGLTSVSQAESSDAGVEGAAAPSKRATPKKAAKKKAGTKKASKGTAKKAGTKPAKKTPAKKASPKKAGSAKQATKQSASRSASKSAGKSASKSGTTSGSTAKAKKPATHRGAAEKSAAKGAAAKRSAGKSVGKSGGTATSKATKKTIKKKPAKR